MNKFDELYEAATGGRFYFVEYDKKDNPVALRGSASFEKIWYFAINEMGRLPNDINGNKLDSIDAVKKRLANSANRSGYAIVELRNPSGNKNHPGMAIWQTTKDILKDKTYYKEI